MVRQRSLSDADLPVVARMFRAGDADAKIAEHFGCSEVTVKRFRSKHGLLKSKGKFVRRPDPTGPSRPLITFEEGGRVITKLPPGFARGVSPEPTVRARPKRKLTRF